MIIRVALGALVASGGLFPSAVSGTEGHPLAFVQDPKAGSQAAGFEVRPDNALSLIEGSS